MARRGKEHGRPSWSPLALGQFHSSGCRKAGKLAPPCSLAATGSSVHNMHGIACGAHCCKAALLHRQWPVSHDAGLPKIKPGSPQRQDPPSWSTRGRWRGSRRHESMFLAVLSIVVKRGVRTSTELQQGNPLLRRRPGPIGGRRVDWGGGGECQVAGERSFHGPSTWCQPISAVPCLVWPRTIIESYRAGRFIECRYISSNLVMHLRALNLTMNGNLTNNLIVLTCLAPDVSPIRNVCVR